MRKKVIYTIMMVLLLAFVPILSSCNEVIEEHYISVRSSNILHGTVHGEGVYDTETEVTLTATENPGSTFVAWIKNNLKISEEKEYSFTANKQTEGIYTAVFKADNTTYYQSSGLSLQFRHLLTNENLQDNTVRITGVTLKLTSSSTANEQTIYNNSELNLEVFNQDQTSDTLEIESDYFLSKLSTYYLKLEIRYHANNVSGSVSKTVLVDFLNMTYAIDQNANSYAVISANLNNSTIASVVKVAFHPAGVVAPENSINW